MVPYQYMFVPSCTELWYSETYFCRSNIYIYIYIHTYTHTYVRTYVRMYIYIRSAEVRFAVPQLISAARNEHIYI